MAWRCAVCYSQDGVNVVCHHCGRPLCDDEKTCRVIIKDEAFAGGKVKAYHCPECARKHHPGATTRLRGAKT